VDTRNAAWKTCKGEIPIPVYVPIAISLNVEKFGLLLNEKL